jgi:adenosylcobinamide-GDP ribazoletransferase
MMTDDLSPRSWWTDFRIALLFLTRLPAGPMAEFRPESLGRALRAGPLVGVVVGALGAVAYGLAQALGLAPILAGLAAVAVTAAVTGALHEDGLGDLADSLAGGANRDDRLAIMRDSRIGTFGALALIFSVALRATALASLGAPALVIAALIAAHSLSRAALPAVMVAGRPARLDGLAAQAGAPAPRHAVIALVLGTVLAVLVAGPLAGLALFCLAALAALSIAWLAQARIGGYTGDVLGAVQQTVEVTILVAATVVL